MSAQAPGERLSRWTPWVVYGLLPLIVASAVAIAYAPALDVPFVYDDLAEIVANRDLHDLGDPARIVGYNPARALLLLTFAAEWHLWGANPLPFHVTNLILHLLDAALVAALTRRLLRGRLRPSEARPTPVWPPFAAALLFAVHPLFVETVTYVASRSSSLCTLFYVAAVLAFSRFRDAQAEGDGAGRWYALTLGLMGLAVATKEIAATLPATLLLFDLSLAPQARGDEHHRRRRVLPHLLPWLLLGGMLFARVQIAGSLLDGPQVRTVPENLMTEAEVVLGYLYRYAVPYPLSIYHDVPTVTQLSAGVVAAAAVHLALIALGLRLLWRGSPFAFPLLWFYLTLTPSSSIIPLKEAMAEHRAYLPGVGLLSGLGLALAQRSGGRREGPARFAVAVIAALFAGLTLSYNRVWVDEISLWRHATALAPHSGDAFYALGDAYRRHDRPGEAIEALQTSINNYEAAGAHLKVRNSTKIVYNYPDALNNLGLAYAMKGDTDRAIAQFRLAARAYPDLSGPANTNLGYALMMKGQHKAAEAALLNALEVQPTNALAHLHLANLYYAFLANRAGSLEHYKAVLKLAPDIPTRPLIEERITELSY